MSNQLAVKDYMRQESVISEFKEVLGHEANSYIRSVLIAVANSQQLQECAPASILTSAMRAATLNLSVDPGIGQAYLVPFKGKCTLIIGYKGLMDMALRTGKYRYLNVTPIYEGEEIIEDRLTGMHSINGGKTSKAVIGYLLYFELVTGFKKTFYMDIAEIGEHAIKYSKSYNQDSSPWKTNRAMMERKTVLRMGLSRWGYFDPHDSMILSKIEEPDSEIIEAESEDVPTEPTEQKPEEPKKSQDQIMFELGY